MRWKMDNLAQRIDDVLTVLYDYEYIDIERFYNNKGNIELLSVLENALNRGYPVLYEMQFLQELYDVNPSF